VTELAVNRVTFRYSMKLSRTIAFRLFLLIATLQTVVVFVLAYATISIQQSTLMEQIESSALGLSDIIVRSTRHSMMLNRKEDVHEIIRSIGREPGIDGIRVYNKQGEVVFATDVQDVGKRVDLNAEACERCHAGGKLEAPATQELLRIFSRPDHGRILGLINPIRNESECSTADCHAHPASKTTLGVLDVKMSLAGVDQHRRSDTATLLLLSSASILLVALTSGLFIWFVVRRPVRELIAGMEMVSSGQLAHRLRDTSGSELGQLARTFNTMAEEVERSRAEVTAWTETLEQKVRQKTEDLERTHRRMVHVEKMASLGALSSSVAHELNNPLEGILTFAKLLIKRIQKSGLAQEEKEGFTQDLQLIADEAARSGNIVKDLLIFSRQRAVAFQRAKLRPIVGRCSLLVNHHAKMHGTELRTSCPDTAEIDCDPGQIQQLMIAMLVNAIEAIPPASERKEPGVVTLQVIPSDGGEDLVLRIADNGMGMTDEVKAHIFEPFFTTKSEGKGVGLGLAIVYGIVERHRGVIDVETGPGKGALFTITLPTCQPAGEVDRPLLSPQEGAHS
jgi:two-component system NtrC family sensor kinase